MTNQEMQAKAKQIKEMQRIRDEAEKEISALQEELKAEMETRGVNEVITGEYKIRYTDVTSPRFDKTSFKAKYTDLYNQFLKVGTCKRFSIL